MYIDALMFQEYPYGVYQPCTPSPETNIRTIQHSLGISVQTFASSDIRTLYLLLRTSGTPINITILNEPISCIPIYLSSNVYLLHQ